LVDALNLALADSYALMALTHLAHWNIEGPGFFSLHKAFQEQYENLFEAVDEVAERVRALDAYAIGGLSKLAKTAGMDEFGSLSLVRPCPRRISSPRSLLRTRRPWTIVRGPAIWPASPKISRPRI
jgi:hypothetical protein